MLNSKATCDWNINKRYLKELEDKGVQIVPTIWPENIDEQILIEAFEEFDADAIVVKPYVSANADNTFWLKKESFHDALPELQETFASRDAMVQPFMQSIVEEGEFSLFFFGDEYSHTILKTPKDDDFRVQEEHGGRLKTLEPEAKLLEQAREIMEKVNPKVLYGRVDLVRHGDAFALMELELIEPSLYFNMDPESPARFAKVVDAWLG